MNSFKRKMFLWAPLLGGGGWGDKNTGVGCHSLLQEIFPTQGLNPGPLHHLSYQGSPQYIWSVYLMLEIHPRGQKDVKGKWKWKSLSPVRLFVTPWTIAYQAPPSVGFSRQEYRSGLLFPSPGDLPNPGIEPGSPALQADALPSECKCISYRSLFQINLVQYIGLARKFRFFVTS